MDKSIYLIGMARSGTYALINWIKNQDWNGTIQFHDRQSYDRYFQEIEPDYHLYRYERDNLRTFKEGKNNKVKHEDQKIMLYLIRDPYNHFASSLKLWLSFPEPKKTRIQKNMKGRIKSLMTGWKQFASQALGEGDYLRPSAIYVNYNQWFSSVDYRTCLAEKLGCKLNDISLQQVVNYANPKRYLAARMPSSFDGKKYDGHAQDMKVLARWKHYENNSTYRSMFDKQIIDYATRLFFEPPFKL